MFKYKPDKLKNQEKIFTLDEVHRKYIKNFEKNRTGIEFKKKQLEYNINKLRKLDSLHPSNITSDDIKLKSQLKCAISRITDEINDITNNISELDYYSKIDNILLSYYNTTNCPSQETYGNDDNFLTDKKHISDVLSYSQKTARKRGHVNRSSPTNILHFFKNVTNNVSHSNTTSIPNNRETSKVSECYPDELYSSCNPYDSTNNSISNTTHIETDCKNSAIYDTSSILQSFPKNRAYLHEQYMNAINSNNKLSKIISNSLKYCDKCQIERMLVQSEGLYICNICGEAESALIESDVPNYKETSAEKILYPYKRLNYPIFGLKKPA